MTYPPFIIVDSSILIAYYNVKDNYHNRVCTFFEQCDSTLITSIACVTEVMNFCQILLNKFRQLFLYYIKILSVF